MRIKRSATSSCTHSTRRAEQRCPALSKADASTSVATCSKRAEESTSIAFWPPVSAINITGWPLWVRRCEMLRWIRRATSVEPVNSTPLTRPSATKAAPTVSPLPGNSCKALGGTPACHSSRTAWAAIRQVCSAGLASATLPAASAAATWPTKIARGKFQGLMHTTGPMGRCSVLSNSWLTWCA